MPRIFPQGVHIRNEVLDLSASKAMAPPRAPDSTVRFYFDTATNRLLVSVDGGAYSPLNIGVSGTSVTNFGAVGDGVTDDTLAIQAALDAAPAGGQILFPPGTFISGPLLIKASDTVIRGAGRGATTIRFNSSTGTLLKSSAQGTSRTGLQIHDITLQGNTASDTANIGLDMSGFSESLLHEVTIIRFGTGLLLDKPSTGSTLYNKFDHCNFSFPVVGTTQIGVDIQRAANAHTFDTCRFSRCATQMRIGSASQSTNPNQITLDNCTFESADTVSLEILRSNTIWIAGGRFEGNPVAIRTAADNLVGDVVIDPGPHFATNTTNYSIASPNVFRGVGGTGSIRSFRYGRATTAQNKCPNGGFEGWHSATLPLAWTSMSTTNFDTTGMTNREATIKRSGSFAMKFGNGTNTFRGCAWRDAIAVEAGVPYTFTFFWTSPHATNGGVRWGFRLLDSASALISTGTVIGQGINSDESLAAANLTFSASANAHIVGSDRLPTVADTYQLGGGIVTFPSGVAFVRFAIFTGSTATGTVNGYIDDMAFAMGEAPLDNAPRPVSDTGTQEVGGNLRLTGNLGVGNSAAASSLGTVTKKIEVFDGAGTSLGFVPVYDAIT